eukprot:383100_1
MPTKTPTNNPSIYPSNNPSETPTNVPSTMPSIVLIKENNNNNNNNLNVIIKNSTLPSIIIIIFASICILWIILCKFIHSRAKKHRSSTISVNDESDNDEDGNIEIVEGEYEYIIEFTSKPFGIVFTKNKFA